MLRFICLVAIIGAVSASQEWNSFKSQHGKIYENPLEETMRRSIFEKNKAEVERFNANEAQKAGYRLRLNHLSDRTPEEMKARNGFRMPKGMNFTNSAKAEKILQEILSRSNDIPESVDWRDVPGRVSDVKDQGQCGSCWAFSATGALEGQMAVKDSAKGLIPLSEQDLVDCSKQNAGCDGGIMIYAWDDIHEQGGIMDEKSYPYEEMDGKCRFDKSKVVFNDKSGIILPQGDIATLKKTVANFGPVAVAINAGLDSFQTYYSGIYNDKKCSGLEDDLNHGVLLVGYGKDEQLGDYWILKNSWNRIWGDKGYIKMAINNNICGVATMAMIPTF